MSILRLVNCEVSLSGRQFMSKINLNIEQGKVYQLVGENGSGKSTLLSLIASKSSSLSCGYLPQVAHQFPKVHFLLRDICCFEYDFYPSSMFSKTWHQSSGGERKKALIAKALSESKDLVILDEPFNHLDPKSCTIISNTINLLVDKGMSVVYANHDGVINNSITVEVNQWRC